MRSTPLRRAFGQLDISKQDRANLIPAVLGFMLNGIQTVDVPNRPGYVYARIRSNLNEMVQVFNDKVSPVYDLPVLLVRDPNNPNRYKVDGRDVGRYENWGNSSSYLPKHGNQHSFNPSGGGGGDITWIYSQQITPWLVSPSGTSGAGCVLIHGYADYTDSWHYFGATGTSDVLAYKPTGTSARMVLVYLDGNGNPQLSPGSTQFPVTSTGTNTILSYLPGVPSADDTPLAGILLLSGTSTILWDDIYDVRPFFGASTASPVVALDDLSDVVITSPAAGQYLRHNGVNWVNQTGSSTVSSLDDLSDVTISALVSGSSLQSNGVGQWINRLQPRYREGSINGHYPDDYLQTNGYGEISLWGQAVRWEKESLPFTAGHVGSSAPTWAAITGSFAGYQFAANNNMIFAVDIPFNWITFDIAKVYISWETSSPETSNKWVKWQVEYKAANRSVLQRYGVPASGTLAAETMIPSGTSTNVAMFTEVGDLALNSNCNIGTTIQFVVTRLASSSGTAPATDPFGIIFGIEYRLDSMGAFSPTQKTVSG